MKGFTLVATTSAILMVGYLGATWYTGEQYQQHLQAAIKQFHSQNSINATLTVTTTERSLFDQKEQYVITIENGPELPVNQQIKFYPGFIKANFNIDLSTDSWQIVNDQLAQPLSGQGNWNASIFTGEGDYQYTLNPFESKELPNDDFIGVGHINITGTFSMGLDEYVSRLTVASLVMKTQNFDIELEGLALETEMEQVNNIYDMTYSKSSLETLRGSHNSATQHPMNYAVEQLNASGTVTHNDDQTVFNSDMSVGLFDFNVGQDLLIEMDNARISTALSKIPTQAYFSILQFAHGNTDPGEIEKIIDQVVANGLALTVEKLGGELFLSSKDEQIKGNYHSKGQIVLEPTSANVLRSQLASQFSVQLDLGFSENMFAKHPLAEQLQHYQESGYFERDNGELTTSLVFDKAKLSLNGQPVEL